MSRIPCMEDYGAPSFSTVVVTGPRFWADTHGKDYATRKELVTDSLLNERDERGEFTLVHGDAKGLDRLALEIWARMGGECIAVPYFGWLGRAGGAVRNKFMLSEYKPRILHSFHDKAIRELPHPGSGTRDCIDRAIQMGIPVHHHVYGRCSELVSAFGGQETLL